MMSILTEKNRKTCKPKHTQKSQNIMQAPEIILFGNMPRQSHQMNESRKPALQVTNCALSQV